MFGELLISFLVAIVGSSISTFAVILILTIILQAANTGIAALGKSLYIFIIAGNAICLSIVVNNWNKSGNSKLMIVSLFVFWIISLIVAYIFVSDIKQKV